MLAKIGNLMFRLNDRGIINRDKRLDFSFNGKRLWGFEGDTLASALLESRNQKAKPT